MRSKQKTSLHRRNQWATRRRCLLSTTSKKFNNTVTTPVIDSFSPPFLPEFTLFLLRRFLAVDFFVLIDLQFRSRRSCLYTKDFANWIETAAVSSLLRSSCPSLSSPLILSLRFSVFFPLNFQFSFYVFIMCAVRFFFCLL